MKNTSNIQPTAEQEANMKEIDKILLTDIIDPTLALNIVINAVQNCFKKDDFNKLDRALISKALACFKNYVDKEEDIIIKCKKENVA